MVAVGGGGGGEPMGVAACWRGSQRYVGGLVEVVNSPCPVKSPPCPAELVARLDELVAAAARRVGDGQLKRCPNSSGLGVAAQVAFYFSKLRPLASENTTNK